MTWSQLYFSIVTLAAVLIIDMVGQEWKLRDQLGGYWSNAGTVNGSLDQWGSDTGDQTWESSRYILERKSMKLLIEWTQVWKKEDDFKFSVLSTWKDGGNICWYKENNWKTMFDCKMLTRAILELFQVELSLLDMLGLWSSLQYFRQENNR